MAGAGIVGPARRARIACALVLLATLAAHPVRAQSGTTLEGRVLDALESAPLAGAEVVLRPTGGALTVAMTTTTDTLGRYVFRALPRGSYVLRASRFGYRDAEIEVTIDRAAPLSVSLLLEPDAFRLDPLALRGLRRRGPSLVLPPPWDAPRVQPSRSAKIRERQERFLASDVRQLSPADIRESNTLAEDDVFRALQSVPGVARRDDFTADLWTRGASAGQTAVRFDGVPVVGALHALGILSGFNSDMLHDATFQRGVAGASSQAGAAAVIDIESRSPAQGVRARSVSVTPVSVRTTVDGVVDGRFAWAVGARRSHVDLVSAIADGLVPGDGEFDYAFRDITARADLVVSPRWRIEASAFAQNDRVFGAVADLARGERATWGTRVARATVVGALHGMTLRSTLGASVFGATVRPMELQSGITLHPRTDNRYRTLLWDMRLDRGRAARIWSAGLTAMHEHHSYNGPDVDLASLLTSDVLDQYGFPQLTPIALAVDRSRRVQTQDAVRLAAWGERRGRISPSIEYDVGLRIESGDATADGRFRLAPRLTARWRHNGTPLSISAAYGRTYQYTQSVARTDVVRSGLRVSEVLVQADRHTWPLRSDLLTLGAELWRDDAWLFGTTAWWRGSGGILLPRPTPGPLDEQQPTIRAGGRAYGLELSARRLAGRVRGFANYSLSRARHTIGETTYDATEDRRHVANFAVIADVARGWALGSTFRFESGAPYTRVILVSTPCAFQAACDDERVPVMLGTMNAQRGSDFASLDLFAEWSHAWDGWALSLYGQLRNVLGRANTVTYHSSCVCTEGDDGSAGWLGDRFDSGLPRLPLVGVRVRF